MIVISISTDGTARAVYNEKLELAALGPLRMRRVSNVEFNETSQVWEVRLCDNPNEVAYSHASRAECIRWEVETLNTALLND